MTDRIYLYPPTSCSLADCKKEYPVNKGVKTNLGIENCELSPYFDCYYRAEIKKNIEPCKTTGWRELNPSAYNDKMSPDFNKTTCAPTKGCNDPSYISLDPRLFSSTRADYLPLDRPPINGKIKLKDIYDSRLDNYGIGFKPYDAINDGQIVYYNDSSISPAFYEPVYAKQANEVISLYKDPMGAIKTVADRVPLDSYNPTVTKPKNYEYSLAFMDDTQGFREDLIALQQRKNNQEKWTVRWGY